LPWFQATPTRRDEERDEGVSDIRLAKAYVNPKPYLNQVAPLIAFKNKRRILFFVQYLGSRQLRRDSSLSPIVARPPRAFCILPETPLNLSYLYFNTCIKEKFCHIRSIANITSCRNEICSLEKY
jgi:hypothetical protein